MSLRNRRQPTQAASTWLLSENDLSPNDYPTSSSNNTSQSRECVLYPTFTFEYGYEDLSRFCEELLCSLKKIFADLFQSSNDSNITETSPISPEVTSIMLNFRSFIQTPYDSSNPIHEETLQHYWNLCYPDTELTDRKSSQWKELGFQGVDPATDFRGGGIFGLRCLVYFASTYPETFHDMRNAEISETQEHYPFSIAGLNVLMNLFEVLGWGFKRNIQNPVATRALISLFFENLENDINDIEPIQHNTPIVESINVERPPYIDLLTGDFTEQLTDSLIDDEFTSMATNRNNMKMNEDSEFNNNNISLFQHDEYTIERQIEKNFFEFFCFGFQKLHQNWIGRPSVAYMDFPIVLQETSNHINDYLAINKPNPAQIQISNQSSNGDLGL